MCVDNEFTDTQATAVLKLLQDRHVKNADIRFTGAAKMRSTIKKMSESELPHKTSLKKSDRDGKGAMDLAFGNVWQSAKQLAENPSFAHRMYLKPEPTMRPCSHGGTERIFGPYNTGLFFEAMQHHFGPTVTIMFIHLFSDETETGWKGSKYPLYG